ncbi:MAG: CYTH domain-containing protein [Bacteroidales bacterium]|nr:CYTH domain-containing protein [Bacteroidales bacterium]
MENTEIERKFLVSGEFRSHAFSSTRICQGYLSSAKGRTVRVRIAGDKAFITIKGPVQGISRFEWEKEIPMDDAQALLEICEPGVIDKTRYLVRNTDRTHVWEVDEFHGENEGLVVAEIELHSEEDTFDKPSWIGEEVSGDRRYYNSSLISNPYSKW